MSINDTLLAEDLAICVARLSKWPQFATVTPDKLIDAAATVKPQRYYNVPELAKATGLTRQTIYFQIRKGEIKTETVLGQIRIPEAEFMRLAGIRAGIRKT